jgi:hypothetical protein
MTEQKKKMLKAKIAAALYHENGKVPTPEEIDKLDKVRPGALYGNVGIAL